MWKISSRTFFSVWIFFCYELQVKRYSRLKIPIFKPDFLETGTFLEKTDTCVEFVLKSSLKWAKVVFFKKSDRMDLIYASVEVQILDVWSELNFFQNFAKNPWNRAYFVQKKITNKSHKSVWVHLVPRFFFKFFKNLTKGRVNTIGIRKYSRNAYAI